MGSLLVSTLHSASEQPSDALSCFSRTFPRAVDLRFINWSLFMTAFWQGCWSTSSKFEFLKIWWWSVMLLINISIKWPVVWLFKCPWIRATSSRVLVLWNQQTNTQRCSLYCHRRLRKPSCNNLMVLLLLIHWSADCCRCVGGAGPPPSVSVFVKWRHCPHECCLNCFKGRFVKSFSIGWSDRLVMQADCRAAGLSLRTALHYILPADTQKQGAAWWPGCHSSSSQQPQL